MQSANVSNLVSPAVFILWPPATPSQWYTNSMLSRTHTHTHTRSQIDINVFLSTAEFREWPCLRCDASILVFNDAERLAVEEKNPTREEASSGSEVALLGHLGIK